MQVIDPTVPLDLDTDMSFWDRQAAREKLTAFARHWHRAAISSQTCRNRLREARVFFNWCDDHDYLSFSDSAAKLFTAAAVKTPAVDFDPDQLRRVLAQGKIRGGRRLKIYVLLGLLLGYYQSDCSQIANDEYFVENGSTFIHRFRSKERRPKRGNRPIKIKHWVAPELAAIINEERAVNPEGFLFNSESGLVLRYKGVENIYRTAMRDAGENLAFKQLRKIGYNRIKFHAGDNRGIAELWDGHAAGVTESYDDGIFLPVVEAQKKFAKELRQEGILSIPQSKRRPCF